MKPTQAVIEAVTKVFPKEASDILAELKYDNIMKCWYFVRWGCFVGVEQDGHIHT